MEPRLRKVMISGILGPGVSKDGAPRLPQWSGRLGPQRTRRHWYQYASARIITRTKKRDAGGRRARSSLTP